MNAPHYYGINETATRNARKEYEDKQQRIIKKCLEIDPDYYKRDLRQRLKIRQQAETML